MNGSRLISIGVFIVVIVVLSYAFSRAVGKTPDVAQEASAAQNADSREIAIITNAMTGSWQSTEDSKFIREFRGDGTMTDSYTGSPDATVSGTWNAFTAAHPDPLLGMPLSQGTVYIKIIQGDEPLFFSIITAAGDTLQMVYINRGSQLNFTRVQ